MAAGSLHVAPAGDPEVSLHLGIVDGLPKLLTALHVCTVNEAVTEALLPGAQDSSPSQCPGALEVSVLPRILF